MKNMRGSHGFYFPWMMLEIEGCDEMHKLGGAWYHPGTFTASLVEFNLCIC